jgi:hypothetical protein
MNIRGYFYQRLKFRTSKYLKNYYLDFSGKSNYDFFDEYDLPVVNYHGQVITFPVTTINYFLGTLDSNCWSNYHTNKLNEFLKVNSSENGLLAHDFDERNWGNKRIWFSSLPQSMLFSLICRLESLNLSGCVLSKEKAFSLMLRSEIYNEKIFYEYPAIKSQPQNGQLFGCLAILDAYHNNLIDKKFLIGILNASYNLCRSQQSFWGWTLYNNNKLASPFYHFLHIDLYKVVEFYDKRFFLLRIIAQFAIIFYPFAVAIKLYEKIKYKSPL